MGHHPGRGGVGIYPNAAIGRDLVDATRALADGTRRIGLICTGAFIWKVAHKLAARHLSTRVEPDSIYARDGNTYTAAGVSAGVDLALALVEEDHGPDLARKVARRLVVYLQRPGAFTVLRDHAGTAPAGAGTTQHRRASERRPDRGSLFAGSRRAAQPQSGTSLDCSAPRRRGPPRAMWS